MEYKVYYKRQEFDLNALLSFDLLKEVLYQLLTSQKKAEKDIEKLKNTCKRLSKMNQIIQENLALNDNYSDDNEEINLSEQEEAQSQKDNYSEKNEAMENEGLKINENTKTGEVKEREMNDNKNDNEEEIINDNHQEKVPEENKNNSEKNEDKLDNNRNNNNNIEPNEQIKEVENLKNENVGEKQMLKNENPIENGSTEKNVEKTKAKENNKIKQYGNNMKIEKQGNYSQQPTNQISPEFIRSLAKQIKDNKKQMSDMDKNIKHQMKLSLENIRADFLNKLKEINLEKQSDSQKTNTSIEDLKKAIESLEHKMEDCIAKCSSIDIYSFFKDSGDGTVDAAKVLVKSLEERVFKKIEFIDSRYKKDASDNLKTKNKLENTIPDIVKIQKDIEQINENLVKHNGEMNEIKAEFSEKTNEIKVINQENNNITKKIENLDFNFDEVIKKKINEIEKEVNDLKDNDIGSKPSKMFNFDFRNKIIDEEIVQSFEKKISDLRKKTNDLENTLKLHSKNEEINSIKNELNNMKLDLEKKIKKDDLKELYNFHLGTIDEINDLKDHVTSSFEEIRKLKSDNVSLMQKIENINGNIILLQNSKLSGTHVPMINFEKYIDHEKFQEFIGPIMKQIEKIYKDISYFDRNITELYSLNKNFIKNEKLFKLEEDMNNKLNDLKNSFLKKFVDKMEFTKSLKQIDIQIKSLDIDSKKGEADSWIMAKKPLGCFNCATCESNIKKVTPHNEYLAWNKYPQQDKIYRMGQGFSKMLQVMTSEFVKSIGNTEKDNEINELSSRTNMGSGANLMLEKSQLNNNVDNLDDYEQKISKSVLKINNKEQINEDVLKKIQNNQINNSRHKGKVTLPRVLNFKNKLKVKNNITLTTNIPITDDENTAKNDSVEKEVVCDNSPKIMKIKKKRPYIKTDDNLIYNNMSQSKG